MRSGLVLSCASSMVGDLVMPTPDPIATRLELMRLQPGINAVPVFDAGDGHGYRSANGRTPEQIIAHWAWENEGETVFNGFDEAIEKLEELKVKWVTTEDQNETEKSD